MLVPKLHFLTVALLIGVGGCSDDASSDAHDVGQDAGEGGAAGTGAEGSGGMSEGDRGGTSDADASGGQGGASGPCGRFACVGSDCHDLIPMPGSSDPTSAEALTAGYFIATEKRYAYLRKDLSMLLKWATCQMKERYPAAGPLGLYDMSQQDAKTPGTDHGQPRHPSNKFVQGTDFATAYYHTDGNNEMRNICGDGTDEYFCGTAGLSNDGFACTTTETIVDIDAQRAFLDLVAQHPDFLSVGLEKSVGQALESSHHSVEYGFGLICAHLFATWSFELPERPNECLSAASCYECCFDNHPAAEPILIDAIEGCACRSASGCDDACASSLCQPTSIRPNDACMACAGIACLGDINVGCVSDPNCMPLFDCVTDCLMNEEPEKQ